MARHTVHYEVAFKDYLLAQGWPFVAVDEAKKAVFADASIKSFDFLVYSASGPNLLVEVKGRKFPDSGGRRSSGTSRAWENWITRDDVTGLKQWEEVFGPDFIAMLVFAYWLQGPPQRAPFQDVHLFRRKHYAFMAIPLPDYVAAARPRSAKWQTITMPTAEFVRKVKDVRAFL